MFSLTQRTRWDLPEPDSPTTGRSSVLVFVRRFRNSSRTFSSVTLSPVLLNDRPVIRERWMLNGVCVERKTAGEATTASV